MESILNSYLCNYCGEKDYTKFPKDRKTTCKKCRYAMKKKIADIERIATEPKKNLRDQFNNFIMNDTLLFDGMSLFQKITDFDEKMEENDKFRNENNIKNINLLNTSEKLVLRMNDYLQENLRLKDENLELRNENLELRKMINLLSERISNLENK